MSKQARCTRERLSKLVPKILSLSTKLHELSVPRVNSYSPSFKAHAQPNISSAPTADFDHHLKNDRTVLVNWGHENKLKQKKKNWIPFPAAQGNPALISASMFLPERPPPRPESRARTLRPFLKYIPPHLALHPLYFGTRTISRAGALSWDPHLSAQPTSGSPENGRVSRSSLSQS